MTDSLVLARPYAKAAFEYAREAQCLAKWSEMLNTLAAYVQQPVLAQFLRDPRYGSHEQFQVILALNNTLDQASQNFIKLLADKDRLIVLPAIAELFAQLLAVFNKTLKVKVKSVLPLTDQEKSSLTTLLNKKFACEIIPHYEIAPELLGGLLVQAGDSVIDSSIRGQLERMREALQVI